DRPRVLDGVGEVRLFRRHQVAQVRLHRGEVRLFLRVGKLRDRDRGQNADDHDHDQQLNERKTLAVHLDIPLWECLLRCMTPKVGKAKPMPTTARYSSIMAYRSAPRW